MEIFLVQNWKRGFSIILSFVLIVLIFITSSFSFSKKTDLIRSLKKNSIHQIGERNQNTYFRENISNDIYKIDQGEIVFAQKSFLRARPIFLNDSVTIYEQEERDRQYKYFVTTKAGVQNEIVINGIAVYVVPSASGFKLYYNRADQYNDPLKIHDFSKDETKKMFGLTVEMCVTVKNEFLYYTKTIDEFPNSGLWRIKESPSENIPESLLEGIHPDQVNIIGPHPFVITNKWIDGEERTIVLDPDLKKYHKLDSNYLTSNQLPIYDYQEEKIAFVHARTHEVRYLEDELDFNHSLD